MPTMTYLTPCVFDHGAVKQLPAILKRLGGQRPLLVTDAGIRAAGVLAQAEAAYGGAFPAVFDATPTNPTEPAVRAALAVYKEAGCDSLVALGGGSSMDLAKGVGLWASHEGPYEKYAAVRGGAKFIGKIPPLVAIATTAGTGSEVSVGAVIIMDNGRKETFVSPNLIPATAICDPELSLGLPARLTAATGMDAMTHCIEAYLAAPVNPPAEAIALDGVWRGIGQGWLKRAVADGSDKDARWHMMMASYEGALAFVKGLGAVHGLSHALGRLADLKLHHGTLNAVILPHSLAMIEERGLAGEKLVRLRQAMGLTPGARVSEAVADMIEAIGVPAQLSMLGVSGDHLADTLPYAVSDLATAAHTFPFGAGEYEDLFGRAL
jgi:4-hydroxybutyrate dehydrogenase